MAIKEVVYTDSTVLQVNRGAVSTLTTTDPHTGLAGTVMTPNNLGTSNHACRGTAWFEGRLWTMAFTGAGGSNFNAYMRRYNASGDVWEDAPDGPGRVNGNPVGWQLVNFTGTHGLFAYQDSLHFFHSYNAYGGTSSVNPKIAREYWQATGPLGVTHKSGVAPAGNLLYNSSKTYSKPSAERSVEHILDVTEYRGNIYVAWNFGVVTFTPPAGTMVGLEETEGEVKTVTSITRVGTTATVTLPNHGYTSSETVTIAGADQPEYNKQTLIVYVDPNTFTYTVAGSPSTPATGTITCQSNSARAANYSRSFAKFVPSTLNARAQLYMVNSDGKIKRAAPTMPTVADVATLNVNIPIQMEANRDYFNPGPNPAGVQIGTKFFVFFVDTTGVVGYETNDPEIIGNYTPVSGIPSPWDNNNNTAIKIITDPSENGSKLPDGEVRIMFVDYGTDAFEIYEFDGTTFTNLGIGNGPVFGTNFFDTDASDVEIEEDPTVDNANGRVAFTYDVFNQTGISGSVSIIAEYSIDGGVNWEGAIPYEPGTDGAAGVQTGERTGLSAVDSLPNATSRPHYTFTWDYGTQIGFSLRSNVNFRIRAI